MLDDGHLYEWFDEQEWASIFHALEQVPAGSRSLAAAIATVDPDILDGERAARRSARHQV